MTLFNSRIITGIKGNIVENDYQELNDGYENKFWVLFENAPDPYYISDLNGKFIEGNKAAEKLLGYRKEELIGKNILKLKILPPSQIPKAAKYIALNKQGKPTGPNELILLNKKREKVWVEVSTHLIKINTDLVVLGIARDITERKKQEGNQKKSREVLEQNVAARTKELAILNSNLLNEKKELKKSQEKYKELFDNAPDGIITINKLGIVTACNRIVYEFTGFNHKDLVGKHFKKIGPVHTKDIPKYLKIFKSHLNGGEIVPFEISFKNKQGETFYGDVHIRKIIENNKLAGFQIVLRDITKKVIAEKALTESEDKFKLLSEATSEGVLVHNKGKIIDGNRKVTEIFGLTREEAIGRSIFNYLDKSSHTKVLKNMIRHYGKPYEAVGLRKDRTRFPIEVCARSIYLDGMKVRVASIRDISAYKESQILLKENEEKFRLLSEATSEGIIIHDKGKIIEGNDKSAKMFGVEISKAVGQSVLKFITPSNRTIVVQKMITNYSKPYEVMAQKIDGTRFPIEVCAKVIPYGGKKVHVASIRDISTYREAEKTIKESEKKFRELSELLPEMVFEAGLNGNINYVNKIGLKLFGYDKKDLDKGLNISEVIEKSDLKKLKDDMEYLISGRNNGSMQYKALKKNGNVLDIEVRSNLITDQKGKPSGIRGTIVDITERIESEEKIKHLSFHDYLTGIYNRAFFEEELKRLDTDRQFPLSIIIGDVNGLKIANDAFGHKRGDELLYKIATILTKSFRKEDIVARWGGDEYSVILPKTNLKKAFKILDRVKANLKKESTKTLPLSISFGLATKNNKSQNIVDIVKEAEDKMYRHKLIEGQSTHSAIISSLEKALEERDYETEEHVKRMKKMATAIGKRMGLPEERIDELTLLAALHDIGKISIADSIILKPRSLNEEEWKAVKKHPQVGYRIAGSSSDLVPIAKGILYHHERWDGKGYPKGIKGDSIPLISRIIAIVDSFDAMTNDRPYRKAMSREDAVEEIRNCAGTQFDPELAGIFIDIVKKGFKYAVAE
jgi:diguanylate cyclase (GGDEF)-like protein/PAS domain S-box-containing protein